MSMLFKRHKKNSPKLSNYQTSQITKPIIKQVSGKVSNFKLTRTIIHFSKSGIKLFTKLFLQPKSSITVNQIKTTAATIRRLNNYPTRKRNWDYKSAKVVKAMKLETEKNKILHVIKGKIKTIIALQKIIVKNTHNSSKMFKIVKMLNR